jgi:hypothetical protein
MSEQLAEGRIMQRLFTHDKRDEIRIYFIKPQKEVSMMSKIILGIFQVALLLALASCSI